MSLELFAAIVVGIPICSFWMYVMWRAAQVA